MNMTAKEVRLSNESDAFKSAVRKLMQVPTHELKEKIAEADAKKDDRASELNSNESDRHAEESCSSNWAEKTENPVYDRTA